MINVTVSFKYQYQLRYKKENRNERKKNIMAKLKKDIQKTEQANQANYNKKHIIHKDIKQDGSKD